MLGSKWHIGGSLAAVFFGVVFFVSGAAIAPSNAVNLLPNHGFEDDQNSDGLPDGWLVWPDKARMDNIVRLVDDEKRGGGRAFMIKHENENSYSKVRTSVGVKPDTTYVASVWLKIADGTPLQRGIDSSHGAKLLVFGSHATNSRLLRASTGVFSTNGRWERCVVRFNSRQYERVMVMFYVYNAKGAVWFDDIELVEGDEPTPTGAEKKIAPFPIVRLLPGTAANQDAFPMIQGEPLPLTFHYEGDDIHAAGLDLEIEVPRGIMLLRDFTSDTVPVAKTNDNKGKIVRYVLPVPRKKVRMGRTRDKDGQMLILETAREPGVAGVLAWRLRRGSETSATHRIAITVLPPLAPMQARPKSFETFTFYSSPLRYCPEGEAGDRLFDRLFQLSLKAGLRGGVIPPVSSNRACKVLKQEGWTSGILAGWMVEPAKYFSKEDLKEAEAIDARGKPDFSESGFRPCPTYCQQHKVMEQVARAAYESQVGRRSSADMPRKGDLYVFDYEPGWVECYCARCLKAFSEHSGIAPDGLTPAVIQSQRADEWHKFRDWQNEQFIAQFHRAVKAISPVLRFGLCDNPKKTWTDNLKPHMDFYCPMMYDVHPRKFFDDVATELRKKKPLLPTIETKMLDWPAWTAPREIKLKILSAAATGAQGIMIWPGTSSLSGLDLSLIRECNDILAAIEDYYSRGKQDDFIFTVQPAEKGYVYGGHRAHALDGRRLLTLFNFHSRNPAKFNVAVPGDVQGEFSLADPVGDTEYLAPSGSNRWNQADLRSGFAIELPPYAAAFIQVAPADGARSAGRVLQLGAATEKFAAGTPYLVQVPEVGIPPVIDGKLDDAAWKSAGVASDFVLQETLAEPQTIARILYDDKSLYMAFECMEPRMDGLAAEHKTRDSAVWKDDCAEAFLQVNPDVYYHIVVNPAGGLYDALGKIDGGPKDENVKWNPAIRLATSKTSDAWVIEIAIPFAGLSAVKPAPADVWKLNLGRSRIAGYSGLKYDKTKQASSWFPAFGSFVPPKFGQMVFLGIRARAEP